MIPFLSSNTPLALGDASLRLMASILPSRCIKCAREVSDPHTLCSPCWQEVKFFLPPWCPTCGLPSTITTAQEQNLCLSCLQNPKIFDIARSVFAYDNLSKPLITTFKNGDKLHAVQALSSWMARIISSSLSANNLPFSLNQKTLVIPVPSHRRTLISRQFYPAAFLAKYIAKKLNLSFAPHILIRNLYASQHQKTVSQRYAQVRHAFSLSPHMNPHASPPPLAILVDDVITTGATVSACTQLLKEAGVAHVAVFSAARVPRILPRQPKWLQQHDTHFTHAPLHPSPSLTPPP